MFKWLKNLFKKREVVYCKDCRWCEPAMDQKDRTDVDNPIWLGAACKSPNNVETKEEDTKLILVADGELKKETKIEPIFNFCFSLRNTVVFDICGPKGKWFEPKEEKK